MGEINQTELNSQNLHLLILEKEEEMLWDLHARIKTQYMDVYVDNYHSNHDEYHFCCQQFIYIIIVAFTIRSITIIH